MGFLLGFTVGFIVLGQILPDRSKPLSSTKVKPRRIHAGQLEMPAAGPRSTNVRSITQARLRML
jgi:hypothetical protein